MYSRRVIIIMHNNNNNNNNNKIRVNAITLLQKHKIILNVTISATRGCKKITFEDDLHPGSVPLDVYAPPGSTHTVMSRHPM